jgi:hypothetical protein
MWYTLAPLVGDAHGFKVWFLHLETINEGAHHDVAYKTMEIYFPLTLNNCATTTISIMSSLGFDIFALLVNFIQEGWVPRHVTT